SVQLLCKIEDLCFDCPTIAKPQNVSGNFSKMQLNPDIPFSTQVDKFSGNNFEKIVAASLYYSGYHIERNLTFSINKETVAEIDVVATLITPLNEIRIAIECKGANPSFNDLRKFSTIRKLLSPKEYFVELILFGSN